MPRPKPGQPGYKGPAHEAVGSLLERLGIDTKPTPPVVKPPREGSAYRKPETYRSNRAFDIMKLMGLGATAEGAEETLRLRAIPNPARSVAAKKLTKARKTQAVKKATRQRRRVSRRSY